MRLGLEFIFHGALYCILFSIFFTAIVAAGSLTAFYKPVEASSWMMLMAGSIIGICILGAIAGTLICIAAPEKHERVWIILVHVSWIAGLAFGLWNTWLSEYTPEVFRTNPLIPLGLSQLIAFLEIWFFLKFFERVASNSHSASFLAKVSACRFYVTFSYIVALAIFGAVCVLNSAVDQNSPLLRNIVNQLPILYCLGIGVSVFIFVNLMLMLKTGIRELAIESDTKRSDIWIKIATAGCMIGTALEFIIQGV